jgi:hypothetical protein
VGVNRRAFEDVNTDLPSAARIYDYFLGGYHNFEVDRVVARKLVEIMPKAPLVLRTNRAFVRRAVRFLAEQGIDQFLDVGSGIPTVGNVHEIAQTINPSARVAYVDIEPVAVRHSEAILKDNPNAVAIEADLHQPQAILDHLEVRRLLDLSQPTAVLITSVLLFVVDDEEAYGAVRVLRDALAPGSYFAISHGTREGTPEEQVQQSEKLYATIGTPIKIRSRAEIGEFFERLELVEPGLAYLPLWRPEGPDDLYLDQPEECGIYGGVGRKP